MQGNYTPNYVRAIEEIITNMSSEFRIVYLESDYPDVLSMLLDSQTGVPALRTWCGLADVKSFDIAKKIHMARPVYSVYEEKNSIGTIKNSKYYKSRKEKEDREETKSDSKELTLKDGKTEPVFVYGPNGKPGFFQLRAIEALPGDDTPVIDLGDNPGVCIVKNKKILYLENNEIRYEDAPGPKEPSDALCRLLYLENADVMEKKYLLRMLQAFLNSKDTYPHAKLILTGHTRNIPERMAEHIRLIRIGAPSPEDIKYQLLAKLRGYDPGVDKLEGAVNALFGLTHLQLQNVYARLGEENLKYEIGNLKSLNDAVAEQKQLEGEKDNTLVYKQIEENPGIAGVGAFLEWLNENMPFLVDPDKAGALGITPPRGAILAGVPGTGKSQLAKQMAYEWNRENEHNQLRKVSLIEFNIGNLSSKEYGSSAEKMDRFLARISEQAPAILFIDEVEKIFYQEGDGKQEMHEVKKQQMGRLLGWMQDHKENIFTFMTSNNINVLPPELIRSGRLSERFIVLMPTYMELMSMLYVFLKEMTGKNVFDTTFNAEIENACQVIDEYNRNYGRKGGQTAILDKKLAEVIGKGVFSHVLLLMTEKALNPDNEKDRSDILAKTVSVQDWDRWMHEKETSLRTPFMTGADMKELVRKTMMRLYRDYGVEAGRSGWTGKQFAAAMEECCIDPAFTPYGQSNLERIAELYLSCNYRDTSAHPILPRYKFIEHEGRFETEPETGYIAGTVPDNLYDQYMQKALVREIVKQAARKKSKDDEIDFRSEQMQHQRNQWEQDTAFLPAQRTFQMEQMKHQWKHWEKEQKATPEEVRRNVKKLTSLQEKEREK